MRGSGDSCVQLKSRSKTALRTSITT